MKTKLSQLIRQAAIKTKQVKPLDQSIIKSGICSGTFIQVKQLNEA